MKFLFALFLTFVFLINCNRSDTNPADLPNKKFDLSKVSGEWQIVPSSNLKIAFSSSETILLNQDGNISKLFMKLDSAGLRILDLPDSTTPRGYFLFSEQKEEIWHGIWEDEMVKLVRLSGQSSSSILE